MSVYTLGLSVLIYNGEMETPNLELITTDLEETGSIMVQKAIEDNKKV
jgi:hypothetical protein